MERGMYEDERGRGGGGGGGAEVEINQILGFHYALSDKLFCFFIKITYFLWNLEEDC